MRLRHKKIGFSVSRMKREDNAGKVYDISWYIASYKDS